MGREEALLLERKQGYLLSCSPIIWLLTSRWVKWQQSGNYTGPAACMCRLQGQRLGLEKGGEGEGEKCAERGGRESKGRRNKGRGMERVMEEGRKRVRGGREEEGWWWVGESSTSSLGGRDPFTCRH